MSMNLKASFVTYLIKKYPNFNQELLQPLISENLLSPFQVKITPDLIVLIKSEIKKYWKLRQWGVKNLTARFDELHIRKPNNFGVCMSYDFHISSDNQLELIEINTNASFLALGLELYSFLELPEIASGFNEAKIIQMFQSENQLAQQKDLKLTIIDEKPEQQRLYIEFLIYQSLLRKNKIPCEIADISELDKIKNSTLVYNRHTDFYLQNEISTEIKKLFNDAKIQLSPHPYEYFLLADKSRFLDWITQTDVERPTSLLPTYDLGIEDKEKIWSERKNLFFKPKNAFGGKQTYKGASMSRKVFDEVTNSNFLAQRISPAPEIEVEQNGEKIKMKYDLRCYVYQDQLQMIIARLYQGQTTNLRTVGGGFACVKF